MKLLNRSALMLLPLSPFVEWINRLPADTSELEEPLPADALSKEGRVYLVAEFDQEQGLEKLMAEHWLALLENELSAWDELGLYWPEPLTQALLQSWFEVVALPLAFDADAAPLLIAQL